jgi:hypothetical protein
MTTASKAAKYAGKLAVEGAKLGGRLLGILGGVAVSALWSAAKGAVDQTSDKRNDAFNHSILCDPDASTLEQRVDESDGLGLPNYYDRWGDKEEQGIWARKRF